MMKMHALLPTLFASFLLAAFNTACTSTDDAPAEEEIQAEASEEVAKPEEEVIDATLDSGAGVAPAAVDANSVVLYFAYDEAIVSEEDKGRLNDLAETLKKNPEMKLQVAGHADERGSIEYNLALGDRRANAVKQYLTSMGVNSSQIQTISYGEEKPAAEGHTEEAWSQNRRANFETLSH